MITDAKNCRVSPDVRYVTALHAQLAAAAGITNPGTFVERTESPWLEYYTTGCGDETRCEDAWVIAELFWGGYVDCLHLALGWMLINAIRIQHCLPAIAPTLESRDRFVDYIRSSGPEVFDAESLRSLFYEHENRVAGG